MHTIKLNGKEIRVYNSMEEFRNRHIIKNGYPEHKHIRLPSGGIANVDPDCSDEILKYLDKLCSIAKKMTADDFKKITKQDFKKSL